MQDQQFIEKSTIGEQFSQIEKELGAVAPDFKEVDRYTTFRAEYAVLDDKDLVFHFFPRQGLQTRSDGKAYWTVSFPTVLSQVASEHFDATYPRLKAAYAEEMVSWWFRANNYDHIVDMDGFAIKFLEKMDQGLDRLSLRRA